VVRVRRAGRRYLRIGQAVGRLWRSGPIPAAPGGANLVSAGASGKPGFATSGRPLYGVVEDAKALPPNTRLSFRAVSCGTDGFATTCLNSADQSGFVLSPDGSYTFG